MKTDRYEPSEADVRKASDIVYTKLCQRLEEKGRGIFISSHETLGIVTEEYQEYCHAVHENNADAQEKELMDIAVAAIFGIASIRSGRMDWL